MLTEREKQVAWDVFLPLWNDCVSPVRDAVFTAMEAVLREREKDDAVKQFEAAVQTDVIDPLVQKEKERMFGEQPPTPQGLAERMIKACLKAQGYTKAALKKRTDADRGHALLGMTAAAQVCIAERDREWEQLLQRMLPLIYHQNAAWSESERKLIHIKGCPGCKLKKDIKAALAPRGQQDTSPNVLHPATYSIGLDKFIDQRNRIVAMDVGVRNSDLRDAIVLAFDLLTQILGEHFPLLAETRGEQERKE